MLMYSAVWCILIPLNEFKMPSFRRSILSSKQANCSYQFLNGFHIVTHDGEVVNLSGDVLGCGLEAMAR